MSEFTKAVGAYAKSYKDILVYHDYQPLLLFWNVSDLFNNRVLWSTYWEWKEQGQEWAYLQYALYFVIALGMLASLPNIKSCVRFVGAYLILYIITMTRFLYLFLTNEEVASNPDTPRAITVTVVYFCLWVWLYVRMKVEIAHKKVNHG